MRWVFFLLLMANGAFYYWHHYYDVDAAEVSVPVGLQGEPIVLLSEAEPPAESASPVVPGSAVNCWARGPYKKYDVARQFADGASGYSVKAEQISSGVEFWVYLGPFGSYEEGNKQHQQLRKKKIDSFVIRSGPLQNAVSLGLFSDAKRAKLQSERMRDKGYKAQIRRLEQAELRYWVVLEGAPEQGSVEEARRQLFNKKNDGASAEKKNCNLVASWK
ncbi:sporulation related protein [Spongiibacter sp. IMCC21906]|uniref:SPOR domain-containing protein n=1 Tax=Spongiibacter sp. IMCC21906 TaxID=1620392 RepID=UPI00062E0910|nr:SPOR domain-containing protein [Spongiibacter sp. IMCC21906]AKH68581.1 sporulation related protein [Spongiibacter sp. IMCC21906]